MIRTKKALLVALLFPIIVLAALTAYRQFRLSAGTEVVLPISGYDPRDLLSGHYLIYTVDYGVTELCRNTSEDKTGYVCLNSKSFSDDPPAGCTQLIRGVCKSGRFEAGIEKYFVAESEAADLEKKVRSQVASIVLSLSSRGDAQVKDLLIDGRPWKSQ